MDNWRCLGEPEEAIGARTKREQRTAFLLMNQKNTQDRSRTQLLYKRSAGRKSTWSISCAAKTPVCCRIACAGLCQLNLKNTRRHTMGVAFLTPPMRVTPKREQEQKAEFSVYRKYAPKFSYPTVTKTLPRACSACNIALKHTIHGHQSQSTRIDEMKACEGGSRSRVPRSVLLLT